MIGGNLVIEETGAFAPGREMTLTRFGGAVEQARGIIGRLAENESQLRSAFSKSGINVWLPAIAFERDIEFVTIAGQGQPVQGTYRVIDAETTAFPYGWSTTRLQLQPEAMP